MQAEQEMLRVHQRMSWVGSVLTACSLLHPVTSSRLLPDSNRPERNANCSRDCDATMRDISEKFVKLRVSRSVQSIEMCGNSIYCSHSLPYSHLFCHFIPIPVPFPYINSHSLPFPFPLS